MATEALRREAPSSREEAVALLREADAARTPVRFAGAGTKRGWGAPAPEPGLEIATGGLKRVIEHNEGDLTAVLEAGVPLALAQRRFADVGQMLALDPPLGDGEAATVGGAIAAADSGPLRHRYGAARDLIVGITVLLSDGTLARAGGKVIKNVAGYDLAKLFTGAFGTLGLIVDVSLRLHPRPPVTATARAGSGDPEVVGRVASTLAHSSLEMESLDVRWGAGRGEVLARFGGAAALEQAADGARLLEEVGGEDAGVHEDDDELWALQRAGQRAGAGGAIVKVAGLQTQLPRVLRAAEAAGATLVARAAHGVAWVALPPGEHAVQAEAVGRLRAELAPSPCTVLDAPVAVREALDVWGEDDGGRIELSRRLKARFDPHGICNPGIFIGGI